MEKIWKRYGKDIKLPKSSRKVPEKLWKSYGKVIKLPKKLPKSSGKAMRTNELDQSSEETINRFSIKMDIASK